MLMNEKELLSDNIISYVTKRNWDKLKPSIEGKLMSGANKCLSKRSVIPFEYLMCRDNVPFVKSFVSLVHAQQWKICDVMFTLVNNILAEKGMSQKTHVRRFLSTIKYSYIPDLKVRLPDDEIDILGVLYQSLMFEGERNVKGAYYTPYYITYNMTKGLDFSSGQTILDPCCGSGAFFFPLHDVQPEQIFGLDNDPVAVMLAKTNLILKYPDVIFDPQIFCFDYFKNDVIREKKFTYIVSNPPWGAVTDVRYFDTGISSKEIFIHFFIKSFHHLENNGLLRFLMPNAVLNVRYHKELRRFMLENGNLSNIFFYNGNFSGVMTKYVDVTLKNMPSEEFVSVSDKEKIQLISKRHFYGYPNFVFNVLSSVDREIIDKIKDKGPLSLEKSEWALGIVTGDNKHKLKDVREDGFEPVFTGKEISKYVLMPCKKFLLYQRESFQQVAKDEYYRAKEKLVYKFISKRLIFAYDDNSSLFLNSANILIPHVDCMSVKTVMAFLNSEVMQYYYSSLFGDVKVLKCNLLELPFPLMTKSLDNKIVKLVDNVVSGDFSAIQRIQNIIYNVYGLTPSQRRYIHSSNMRNKLL